jgi:hypothetical protein
MPRAKTASATARLVSHSTGVAPAVGVD